MSLFIRPVVAAFLLGTLLKGTLIAVAEASGNPRLIGWLLVDPAVPLVASPLTATFFGQQRTVPSRPESLVFDVFVAAGFGLECALAALIGTLFVFVRRRQKARAGHVVP
jgi:hypothetical protein